MTVTMAEAAPAHRMRAAERLHEVVLTQLGIDTDDVLVSAHADGTVTAQLAATIARADEPHVQTLSLPRGHCGFVGNFGGSPGLSIDLHRDYVTETDAGLIRRDALAILETVCGEMRGRSPQVWGTG